MFVFTGFNTMSGIQTLIFNSATKEHSGGFVPGFQGNGFIASAVIYGVFSIASWLAPSVVAWKGPRFAMFVPGCSTHNTSRSFSTQTRTCSTYLPL